MDEAIARAIARLPDLGRVQIYEENAGKQGRLDHDMRAALTERRIELGRQLVADRTGIDLSRLTPAEERIVRAAGEYASIKKRNGTNAERTLRQIRERGLIGAAEAAVMRSKPTPGFGELVDNGLTELSYEQIIVDNPDEFSDRALWYARRTLNLRNDSPQAPARLSSPTQRRTEALLAWLAERARAMDGGLGVYSNAEAAAAIGMPDLSAHGRVFGNIQSRVDFACYRLGLPPLGLAAIAPFDEAWQPEDRTWSFPVSSMQEAAKTFRWRDHDFARVLKETEGLPGQASISWHADLREREESVRAWTFGLSPNQESVPSITSTAASATTGKRNPDWTREEHVLALDLYLRFKGTSYDDEMPEVVALSAQLQDLAALRGMSGGPTFRNPAGVSMKMMNFRRLDPDYTSDGRVGLQRGSNAEEEVWRDYANDPAALAAAKAKILSDLAGSPTAGPAPAGRGNLSNEDTSAIAELLGAPLVEEENAVEKLSALEDRYKEASPERKSRVSKYIERGPIGAAVKKANGYKCQLCEAMGLNPVGFLKKNGVPYVEAHHVTQVSTGTAGCLSASNVMTLCANHHREMHYGAITVITDDKRFTVTINGSEMFVERYEG